MWRCCSSRLFWGCDWRSVGNLTSSFFSIKFIFHLKRIEANRTTWAKSPQQRRSELYSPRLMTVVHSGSIWNRILPARIASTHSCITRIGRRGWGRCSSTEMTGMKRPVVIILRLYRRALVQISYYTAEKQGSPTNCIRPCWWMWIRSGYWPTAKENTVIMNLAWVPNDHLNELA